MLGRCPSCRRLFQAKEVKRELLAVDKLIQKDPLAPYPMEEVWQDNFDKEKYIQTYKVTFKCKHCGHEWTDLTQK